MSAASQVAAHDIHTPADCHYCGERAHGIGVGFTSPRDKDPKWVCVPCSLMLEDFRRVKRMDAYSLKAREGGVEAAADVIAAYGTELSEYTDEKAAILAGAIWRGCAARLRELVRSDSPPF